MDIQHLIEQMTIEEKVAQLSQLAGPFFKGSSNSGHITGPMASLQVTEKQIQNAGSVLGVSGASEVRSIQQKHIEENRLGIPLIFMADIVHGFRTIFPIPLALGCSWDPGLAKKSAEAAGREAAASGVHVTFAPMVDLVRDPRWGRVMESTGEDPYINGLFAKAFVEGFQRESLTDNHEAVAACVKHFAAYGAAEAGRDYNTVDMSERQLRESYLPAYKAALDAGCEMVMTAFNIVDGIPATANRKLMRDLLRDEWGFNGVLISDWGAVKELIPHGVAENEKEAALKAMTAGLDIEMMTACYAQHAEDLIKEGQLDESLLNEAVTRVLELKEKMGLFDDPYRGISSERESEIVGCSEHRELSREIAAKSIVLLKNHHYTLPIKPEQRIALVGPFAKSQDLLGPWSAEGKIEEVTSIEHAFEEQNLTFTAAEGCGIHQHDDSLTAQAIDIADQSDVVVLTLGESSLMSGEANSRTDIQLPEAQLNLLREIKKTGKPVVTVVFSGRPLDIKEVHELSDAVMFAWFPGSEGGHAVTDCLTGSVNPSAKLTMSFPHNVGQIPVYYNHFNTGRPKGAPDAQEHYVSDYMDAPNDPFYPFGYGLSYTTFDYSELKLSGDTLHAADQITASVTVKNTGTVSGDEIVQLYIRDVSGETVRPLKELKGFERITLEPGASESVTFSITENMLRYHHSDLSFCSDPGTFEVFIGPHSLKTLKTSFTLV
ncbi:glycoside hydrolase family 3 N-terminal domain-containing protein [Jeotgalibacillus malaysiensis]|uniref:glycoside hydrolase family 3 N-terminal domain-containing protein n=1 Tax=Jeotgalibacillus malaysiensis TaxID=1508404 RepID=UPI00385007BF